MAGTIRKRSVIVAGHRTSVSLEPEFWAALRDIAERRGLSINALVAEVDHGRSGNLSSALRVFVLSTLQSATAVTEIGSTPRAGSMPDVV